MEAINAPFAVCVPFQCVCSSEMQAALAAVAARLPVAAGRAHTLPLLQQAKADCLCRQLPGTAALAEPLMTAAWHLQRCT